VPFQVSQDLPQAPWPLPKQIIPDDLRKLVEKNSPATPQALCEFVEKERGIKMSTTAMCGLPRWQAKTEKPLWENSQGSSG